jgi:hypothetical protein
MELTVDWAAEVAGDAAFRTGIVRDVTAALERWVPDRVTLVGKSMGGHALRVIIEERLDLPEDVRLVWLTPGWARDQTWKAARETTIPSLYVVGLADHEYHVPERHAVLPGRTLTLHGADHRLEVAGDVFATLDAWRQMAEAVPASPFAQTVARLRCLRFSPDCRRIIS